MNRKVRVFRRTTYGDLMPGPTVIEELNSRGYIEIEDTYKKQVWVPRNSDRCRREGIPMIVVETVRAIYVGKKRVKVMKPIKTGRFNYSYFHESGKAQWPT